MLPVGLSGCGWKTTSVDMDPFPMSTTPVNSGSPGYESVGAIFGPVLDFGRKQPRPPPGVASRSNKPVGEQKFSILMRPCLHNTVKSIASDDSRSDWGARWKVGFALFAVGGKTLRDLRSIKAEEFQRKRGVEGWPHLTQPVVERIFCPADCGLGAFGK